MTTGAPTRPADASDELERVREKIVSCRRCPRLVSWRERSAGPDGWARPVPGFGDPDARLFLLGLATSAGGGNRTGRAFTANRSASFLVAALHRAGLANQDRSEHLDDGLRLHDAWMASAVRCPPPANRPTAAEQSNCAAHLRAEWAALTGLRVVVALGGLAWRAAQRTTCRRPLVPFAHGRELVLTGDVTLLGSYHPSPQNTNTGLLTPAMLDTTLARARVLADRP